MDYTRVEATLRHTLDVLQRKGQDYGTANISAVGERGVVVRLLEKLTRLNSLNGKAPSNEGASEAWADIVNYALIGQMVNAGAWQHDAFLVYLAGPIDDVSTAHSSPWRHEAAALLKEHGVASFLPTSAYQGAAISDARIAPAVSAINRCAIERSSHLLANLDGPGRGFGTIREIEYARSLGKPVVVVGTLVSLEAHDVVCVPTFPEAVAQIVGLRA